MNFKPHYELKGKHAFLSPSKYNWVYYDEEKLRSNYINTVVAQARGTRLHELAAMLIEERQKLPRSKKTLNSYVNDAIGFGMKPEVALVYTDLCFGHADAVAFDEDRGFLRIHDLKTGIIPAHMEQLLIYDALFCLEYRINPKDIQVENRIYQCDAISVANPSPDELKEFVDMVVEKEKWAREVRAEVSF